MNRVDEKFRELRINGRKAFIAFIMAGDPTLSITKKLIFELQRVGVDILELGLPFSDPLADGVTIQRSSERALRNRVNVDSVSNLVKKVRLHTEIPIIFLTYYNLVYRYSVKKFVQRLKTAGVDGVIIPDLPPEESGELRRIAKEKEFSVIHLVAPTSSQQRIIKVSNASSGFIYYVSLTGTTGVRKQLPEEISVSLNKIKALTKLPVCVGFGISRREQVKEISKSADGVIVGSAIIKVIEKNLNMKERIVKEVGSFVRGLMEKRGV